VRTRNVVAYHCGRMSSLSRHALIIGNSDGIGLHATRRLLDRGWRLKQQLADGMTNSIIDDLYTAGIESGAAAFDVHEFFRAQVGRKAGLGDDKIGEFQRRTSRDAGVGALSDIGRATAMAFAKVGYAVILNHRHSEEQAREFANVLLREGGAKQVEIIRGDVRHRAEVSAMFAQACRVFGSVDVLINNAGINRDRSFVEMSDEEWEVVVDTILKGTFICSQEYARRYTGSTGSIINIGSVTALKGRPNGANYCSARAGVLALTKCMAQELAPRIRVNTVTPGRIDTEELRGRYQLEDARRKLKLEQEVPMQRLGTPEEVADMILYLESAGQYITGQNFLVDGGLFMR